MFEKCVTCLRREQKKEMQLTACEEQNYYVYSYFQSRPNNKLVSNHSCAIFVFTSSLYIEIITEGEFVREAKNFSNNPFVNIIVMSSRATRMNVRFFPLQQCDKLQSRVECWVLCSSCAK